MVCPNCGTENHSAKYCSECGCSMQVTASTKNCIRRKCELLNEDKVFCPKCLSENYTIYRSNSVYDVYPVVAILVRAFTGKHLYSDDHKYGTTCVCLQCGNYFRPKVVQLQKEYIKCLKRFLNWESRISVSGIDGSSLEIYEGHLEVIYPGVKPHVIPFETLASVDHRESKGAFYGRLTFRDVWRKSIKPPKKLLAVPKDKATILYEHWNLNCYRKINSALKAIIEVNRKAGLL